MSEFPHSALSDYFQERMQGRRLLGAVFTTFQLDPAFFEREVLPVFFDAPFSHLPQLRSVQLEELLRDVPSRIAVYYDVNGLSGESESATLDYLRIPVRHPRGIFHPKNVFLLVETKSDSEDAVPERSLIVASLSANLTRSGWWENVEVAHVEEIAEGSRSRVRDELRGFLRSIRRATSHSDHAALRQMSRFLRRVRQRERRTTDRRLNTHFFGGRGTIVDFLDRAARRKLTGCYLEVISPFFDDAPDCRPLLSLIERFEPKEVRIYLPVDRSGTALIREDLFASISALDRVTWGRLPESFLRLGAAKDSGERRVHAKVYRFFRQKPKREILFVGSANLTTPAHQAHGNIESGFLVEALPSRRPDFWLSANTSSPSIFAEHNVQEDASTSGGTPLMLRYHWDRSEAEVYWDQDSDSLPLEITARGIHVCALASLPGRTWKSLISDQAKRIAAILPETSLFWVRAENVETQALLLVQEEGMSHKPSLLMRLTPTDILEYWSLLTPDQKARFLEEHAPPSLLFGMGSDLTVAIPIVHRKHTIFDRFAGYFHAFSLLERSIRRSLDEDNPRDADYRLFGQKYDSLGSFLANLGSADAAPHAVTTMPVDSEGSSSNQVPGAGIVAIPDSALSPTDEVVQGGVSGIAETGGPRDVAVGTVTEELDLVDRYVIVLCARQLCRHVAAEYPEYWAEHRSDVERLEAEFAKLHSIRDELIASDPDLFDFLDWFDPRFLSRAEPVAASGDAR
jgi:hypothetical protein